MRILVPLRPINMGVANIACIFACRGCPKFSWMPSRPKSLPEKKRTELQDVSQDVGRDGEQAMDSAGC
jgi:hypothetical protein